MYIYISISIYIYIYICALPARLTLALSTVCLRALASLAGLLTKPLRSWKGNRAVRGVNDTWAKKQHRSPRPARWVLDVRLSSPTMSPIQCWGYTEFLKLMKPQSGQGALSSQTHRQALYRKGSLGSIEGCWTPCLDAPGASQVGLVLGLVGSLFRGPSRGY